MLIHVFHLFLQIAKICFQKATVQYITFKTAALVEVPPIRSPHSATQYY